jgi:hypothetical protein
MTAPGDLLRDRYRIERLVSSGGMAAVYEAEDTALARRVAVKVFHGGQPEDRARFDVEAQILARLDHPTLVKVYDAGEHAGDAFVVLEFVDGPTLAQTFSEEGALPPDRVAGIALHLAGGLAAIHAGGVVHRDVKPGNVLLDPSGLPRLTDFGIARLVDTTRLTATGTTLGTAAYMAPEQLEGAGVDASADVYALGLVLLEALTGEREFPGTPTEAAIARTTRDPAVPPELPAPWPGLLAGMTARDPRQRPSASEVETALSDEAVTAGVVPWATATQAVATAGPGPATRPLATTDMREVGIPPPRRRWGWLLAVPFLLALGLVAGLVALALLDDGDVAPADESVTTVPESVTTTTEAGETTEAPVVPAPTTPSTEATTTTSAPEPTTTEVTETTSAPDTTEATKPKDDGGGGGG